MPFHILAFALPFSLLYGILGSFWPGPCQLSQSHGLPLQVPTLLLHASILLRSHHSGTVSLPAGDCTSLTLTHCQKHIKPWRWPKTHSAISKSSLRVGTNDPDWEPLAKLIFEHLITAKVFLVQVFIYRLVCLVFIKYMLNKDCSLCLPLPSLANSYSSFKVLLKYEFCKGMSNIVRWFDLAFSWVPIATYTYTSLSVLLKVWIMFLFHSQWAQSTITMSYSIFAALTLSRVPGTK